MIKPVYPNTPPPKRIASASQSKLTKQNHKNIDPQKFQIPY